MVLYSNLMPNVEVVKKRVVNRTCCMGVNRKLSLVKGTSLCIICCMGKLFGLTCW